MEKFEKVLGLLKEKNGRIEGTVDPATGKVVWEADVQTLLGDVTYRLADYISRIRKNAKLDIRGERQGRKVVAYVLTAIAPDTVPSGLVGTLDERQVTGEVTSE